MNDTIFDESINAVKAKAFDSLSARLKNFEAFHSDALSFLEQLQDAAYHLDEVVITDTNNYYKKIVELIKQGYALHNHYETRQVIQLQR